MDTQEEPSQGEAVTDGAGSAEGSLFALGGTKSDKRGDDKKRGDEKGDDKQHAKDWLPGGGTPAQEVLRLAFFWAEGRFRQNDDEAVRLKSILERKELASAPVDECFNGIGEPLGRPPCLTGQDKRNDAYVWGLTKVDSQLYFGTIANTLCLVESGFLGADSPQLTSHWVCEFDASASGTGDFRAPHLYRYDLKARQLVSLDPPPGHPANLLRQTTVGFRSAGNQGGVVFLAGPSVRSGINMFAFDAYSGALLGARNFPQWSDIRTWVSTKGALYAGVQNAGVTGNAPGGSVLRWRGSRSTSPDVLFQFELVGSLETEAANLVEHEGTLCTTTWPMALTPGSGGPPRFAGLFCSPPFGKKGLGSADANRWTKLWSIADYDPDPIAAAVTGGGAIASFEGKLIWGTMHVPFLATTAALATLDLDADGSGSLDAAELAATALGSHRSVALFKAETKYGRPGAKVEVLYGDKYLPRYDPTARRYTIAYDAFHLNRAADPKPEHGSSGVGNFFNAYVWSMDVFHGALYVGTFDWSQVARVGAQSLVTQPPVTLASSSAERARHAFFQTLGTRLPREGADLFRFEDADKPAQAESLTGVGNDTNYGIRTMVSDKDALYLGTANPMNLHPRGGWELLKMER